MTTAYTEKDWRCPSGGAFHILDLTKGEFDKAMHPCVKCEAMVPRELVEEGMANVVEEKPQEWLTVPFRRSEHAKAAPTGNEPSPVPAWVNILNSVPNGGTGGQVVFPSGGSTTATGIADLDAFNAALKDWFRQTYTNRIGESDSGCDYTANEMGLKLREVQANDRGGKRPIIPDGLSEAEMMEWCRNHVRNHLPNTKARHVVRWYPWVSSSYKGDIETGGHYSLRFRIFVEELAAMADKPVKAEVADGVVARTFAAKIGDVYLSSWSVKDEPSGIATAHVGFNNPVTAHSAMNLLDQRTRGMGHSHRTQRLISGETLIYKSRQPGLSTDHPWFIIDCKDSANDVADNALDPIASLTPSKAFSIGDAPCNPVDGGNPIKIGGKSMAMGPYNGDHYDRVRFDHSSVAQNLNHTHTISAHDHGVYYDHGHQFGLTAGDHSASHTYLCDAYGRLIVKDADQSGLTENLRFWDGDKWVKDKNIACQHRTYKLSTSPFEGDSFYGKSLGEVAKMDAGLANEFCGSTVAPTPSPDWGTAPCDPNPSPAPTPTDLRVPDSFRVVERHIAVMYLQSGLKERDSERWTTLEGAQTRVRQLLFDRDDLLLCTVDTVWERE